MWTIAAAGLLTISAMDVDVQPLNGDTASGRLTAIGNGALTITTAEGSKSLAFTEIIGITPKASPPPPAAEATAWLQLIDGTKLSLKSYTVGERKAEVELPSGMKLSIPTRSIAYVRFQKQSDVLKAQWNSILKSERAGDVIVIRRSEESLDQLEGVANDVTTDKVQFVLGDDTIPVNRGKLDGIIYYHAVGRKLPASVCELTDATNNVWNLRSLKLNDEKLQITTTSNVRADLPLSEIKYFDFSAGNIVYLSDIDPELIRWTPFHGPKIPSEARMYAPQRNRGLLFDGEKLLLGNRAFSKGLAVHSRTELVYRLTEEYKNFHTLAGIDDRVGDDGSVELIIYADDRELFRKLIQGGDEPLPIHLKIKGVKRLKILVDYGEKSDVADHLNLCQVRITK